MLWFAFKLVSLNHWEQSDNNELFRRDVVICFQISIFEPLGTIQSGDNTNDNELWFAFKLVSLNHWEQSDFYVVYWLYVVICFQISIFEPLGTIIQGITSNSRRLWFAFKLVSLNHWEQCKFYTNITKRRCDLLSN